MGKLEKLTQEQQAAVTEWHTRYLAAGIDCAPADRPRAESAFARAYCSIGREPVPVVWVDSPITASLAFAAVNHLSLKENGASLGDSLRDSLRASLRDSLGDSEIEPQYTYWWGQQDLYWVAYYKFCPDVLGVPIDADAADRLDIMHEIAMSCMWWYPRDGVIIACERPAAVYMQDGRLHNDDGPAVEFRDGWKVYAVRGFRVPPKVFEQPISVAAIEAETNAEVRRIMVERYKRGEAMSGAAAYLLDSGAEVVDDDPEHGTLYRQGRPDDSDLLMVRVTNNTVEPDGTLRQFFLRVHPELRPMMTGKRLGDPQPMTARNAVASTWGMRGEEFAPEART